MFEHPPTELRNILTYPKSTLFLLFASVATLLYIYFFHPVFHTVTTTTHYLPTYYSYETETSETLAGWAWRACNSVNGFLHGRLIPLFSTTMLILAWHRNRTQPIAPSYWGLVALLIGLLFFYAGIKAIQPRYTLFGTPFVIVGLAHHLFGKTITKATLFPAFFLWFTIPIPGMAHHIFNFLTVLSHSTAVNIGQIIGIHFIASGSTIIIGEHEMDTARSVGERMTWFLIITASIYANFSQRVLWKKLLLFFCAIPFLILAYSSRLLLILSLVHFNQVDFAKKTFHDWAGLLVIIPVFLSLLLLSSILLKRIGGPPQPLRHGNDPSTAETI